MSYVNVQQVDFSILSWLALDSTRSNQLIECTTGVECFDLELDSGRLNEIEHQK
jgi:hypothetical protein